VLLGWFSGIANLQIDLSMASTLGEGSVPSLRYAFRWVQLPAGLFFSTVGVVMLPTLSRAISDGDSELVARTLRYACRVVAAVLLPAAVGAAVLAPTLIALLYERGAFAPADTLRTATALRAYAPAIVAFGYLNVALSALHAHRQQRTAAIIGVASIVLNATLNALLMSRYQTAGIAMSSSIVTTLNVVAVALLRPELRGLFRARGLGSSLVRACIGCAVMAFVLVLLPREAMLGKSWGVGDLLLRVAVGTLSYAAILWALRGGELRELQDAILKRSG
jgi:putative peptidoglycan lipid II flippase